MKNSIVALLSTGLLTAGLAACSAKKVTLSGLAGVELGQGDCNANKVLLNEALPAASATEANRWYSFDELDEAVTSKAGAAVAKLTVERYRAALNRACK